MVDEARELSLVDDVLHEAGLVGEVWVNPLEGDGLLEGRLASHLSDVDRRHAARRQHAAAAAETLRVIREEVLRDNAYERGVQLVTGLRKLQEEYPALGDVRGLGLMIGAEFRRSDRTPDKDFAKLVVKHSFERGLMLLTCGPWDNTIRFIPPLTVSQEEIAEGLKIVSQAIEETASK